MNPLIMHFPLITCLLGPYFSSSLCSQTQSIACCSLKARDQVVHPYKPALVTCFISSCTRRGYITVFVVGRIGKDTLLTPPMSMSDVATPL
jgi:hypothetical protein